MPKFICIVFFIMAVIIQHISCQLKLVKYYFYSIITILLVELHLSLVLLLALQSFLHTLSNLLTSAQAI